MEIFVDLIGYQMFNLYVILLIFPIYYPIYPLNI